MERSEAVEIVREYYPSSGKDLNEALETLIPELKESEDERIRKALIQHIKYNVSVILGWRKEELIAWLEKQGSQNLANSAKTCKDEPKFNVGDWVVYNGDICQIVKREEGCNKLVTNFGIEKELINERNLSTAQPWTIQDAKEGDVLCTYECNEPKIVFILKGTSKKQCALSYYCYYNIMYPHFDFDSEKGCLAPNDEDVKPATKEQRDLLFQKMKEADYDWDADKKEFKKIKQESIWNENTQQWIDAIIKDYEKQYDVDKDHRATIQIQIDILKSLKERCAWKPSDEQIKVFEHFVRSIGESGYMSPYDPSTRIIYSLLDDLKKLKG